MTLKPIHLPLLLIAVCAGMLFVAEATRRSRDLSTAGLLKRLPQQEDGVQFFVDTQVLRQAGVLDMLVGSRASEELDYRRFVEAVRFDYREDLNVIVGVFAGQRSNFILSGRMHWPAIRDYGLQHGAQCRAGYCWMEGRSPERILSFYPVGDGVLSVSIDDDQWGAKYTTSERPFPRDHWIPSEPFWVSVPAKVLREPGGLPPGAAAFASQVRGAARVTIALGAAGEGGGFRAEMRARFSDSATAAESRANMEKSTATLQSFLDRAKQNPGPREFARILVSGRFTLENNDVVGRWPISREFLEALSEGSLETVGSNP